MASDGEVRSFKDHKFQIPTRLVKGPEDLQRWEKSQVTYLQMHVQHVAS